MRRSLAWLATIPLLAALPADAKLRPQGDPFPLSDCADCLRSFAPSLAGAPGGHFYITWAADLPTTGFAAFGRAFDVDEGPREARRLGVDPERQTGERNVGVDGAGNFVALWQHPAEIWLDRLDGDGVPTAPSFRVNDPPTGADDDLARIGVDADGHAAVAFFTTTGTQPVEVYAQVVSPDNQVAAPASRLSGSFPVSLVGGLHVAALGESETFYILWETKASADEPPGLAGPRGLSLRRVDRQGAPVGPEIVVRPPSGSERTLQPHLAADPRGEFVVVSWATNESPAKAGVDAVAQLFAPDGSALDDPFVLSKKSGGAQRAPTIAFTPRAQIVAVWETLKGGESRIWARRLRRDGRFRGREQAVANTVADPGGSNDFGSFLPQVASVGGGLVVVVWIQDGELLGRLVSGAR